MKQPTRSIRRRTPLHVPAEQESVPTPAKKPQNVFTLLEQWDAAPYDGLRGKLREWVPEMVVIEFMAYRLLVAGAIIEKRSSLSEALAHLGFHMRKEMLLRKEDQLLEAHRHKEALIVGETIIRLDPPKPCALDDAVAALARLRGDLKLGKKACLRRWLGEHISANNRIGERQRDRGAVGGRKSGKRRRATSVRDHALRIAISLRLNGEPRRGLAKLIKSEGEFPISVRQINSILKEGGIK